MCLGLCSTVSVQMYYWYCTGMQLSFCDTQKEKLKKNEWVERGEKLYR